MKESAKEIHVRSLGRREIPHRPGAEEKSPHRARVVRCKGNTELAGNLLQAPDQCGGAFLDPGMERRGKRRKSCDPRSHRRRIPGQRARLVDGARWGDLLHQFPTPTIRCNWEPAADHLPKRSEI